MFVRMRYTIFDSVPDHRVTGRCTYRLSDLLTIALLTYLCNGVDYVDMSEFAHTRARDFGLLEGCAGSPSPDTFERLMSAVNPDEIERCLVESGRQFLSALAEKQVALDGKKLRGANPTARGSKGDYLLNAFVSENALLIGQLRVEDKENEIPSYPLLLDKIDVAGAVVSIDAMGTQVEVAQKILDKVAHYFLAVKDNQRGLHEAVAEAFRLNAPADKAVETDGDHGRVETRTCRILPATAMAVTEAVSRWPRLGTIAEVETEVYSKKTGETAKTTRHYISDETFGKAAYYNMLARGHWSIENLLHWHLDVTFLEDDSRARKGNAPQNLSLIRKLALQVAKAHNDKRSLRKRLFKASLDPNYLIEILANYRI